MPLLDTDRIEAFRRDGVVLLEGVFAGWVDTLRAGVERNMADPGPYGREYIDGEHVLVKEPGTDKITPWHHDQPYYCVDGRQVCSLWIPLDPVARETCPEFIAGSHDWGRWFLPRKFTGIDYDHDDARLEAMPDIEADRGAYDIRSWELEPGDAIAFHFMTVHGAPANRSARRRRGFAARWLGDDAIYARRGGEVSPPFPGLDDRLQPGDPLDTEEFPLVYPRS